MLDKKHVDHVVIVVLLISIILVNYMGFHRIHIGDFYSGFDMIYPPPYKAVNEVVVYDIRSDRVFSTKTYGFIFSINTYSEREYVVSIYGEGPDLYVLGVSVLVILTYVLLIRKLLLRNLLRKYVFSLIAIGVIISLTTLYIIYSSTPIVEAEYLELDKPFKCTQVYGRSLCLVDVFDKPAITYVRVNSSTELIIYRGEYLEQYSLGPGEDTSLFFNGYEETRIALLTPNDSPLSIYRRVSFNIHGDHVYLPLLLTFPIAILLILVFYLRKSLV